MKWEVSSLSACSREGLVELGNESGECGWELASIYETVNPNDPHGPPLLIAWFKRPKQDPPKQKVGFHVRPRHLGPWWECLCQCHGLYGETVADHALPCCNHCQRCDLNIAGDFEAHKHHHFNEVVRSDVDARIAQNKGNPQP